MPQYPYSPVNVDLGKIATLTAAGSGTVNSTQYTNSMGAGAVLRFYCTAESGTAPTITVNLQGYDPASGEYWTVGTSGAWTPVANTMFTLTVYPGMGAGSGDAIGINAALPLYWRVQYVIAGTTPSITGTIGGGTLV